MISLIDIAKRIEQPEQLFPSDIEGIKEYSEKYPYSQLFSILYLKGLSNNSDVRFEEELQNHSYRISDRARLYQLISENEEQENSIEEELIAETPTKKVEAQEIVTAEKEPKIVLEKENLEISQEEEIIHPKEDISIETIEEKLQDKVDESILQHAFSANYQLPELNQEEKIALEEKNISSKIEVEKLPEIEPVEIVINTKQSFSSWLSSNSNYERKENQGKSAINYLVSESEGRKSEEKLFGEVKKEKTAFFSPTQKAKESLQENTLPVSETLAKIYALQGNFPKAISAYHQLSLNYPEKKIFFAIRIKELEKKLNTK